MLVHFTSTLNKSMICRSQLCSGSALLYLNVANWIPADTLIRCETIIEWEFFFIYHKNRNPIKQIYSLWLFVLALISLEQQSKPFRDWTPFCQRLDWLLNLMALDRSYFVHDLATHNHTNEAVDSAMAPAPIQCDTPPQPTLARTYNSNFHCRESCSPKTMNQFATL